MSDEVEPASDEYLRYLTDGPGNLTTREHRLLARLRAEQERADRAEGERAKWASLAESEHERARKAEEERDQSRAALAEAEAEHVRLAGQWAARNEALREERDRLRGQAMKAARHCALGCRHCVDVTLEHEA